MACKHVVIIANMNCNVLQNDSILFYHCLNNVLFTNKIHAVEKKSLEGLPYINNAFANAGNMLTKINLPLTKCCFLIKAKHVKMMVYA